MKNLLPVLLLALVGCGNPSPNIPSSTGDFVKNDNGVGTAQVFGIEFRVNVNSSGATSEGEIDANFVAPEKSSGRKGFTIGDDVAIQLESVNESEVSFVFIDQVFGTLNVGDEVVIDDERNVVVNGTTRLPKSAE